MANFVMSNTPPLQWVGGPANDCSICKFPNSSGEQIYLTCLGTYVEEPQPLMNGQWTDRPFMLCAEHIAEVKAVLDESFPDPAVPSLQAKLFKAEAARAKAEKRAELAEGALHAMQDWVSETPKVL